MRFEIWQGWFENGSCNCFCFVCFSLNVCFNIPGTRFAHWLCANECLRVLHIDQLLKKGKWEKSFVWKSWLISPSPPFTSTRLFFFLSFKKGFAKPYKKIRVKCKLVWSTDFTTIDLLIKTPDLIHFSAFTKNSSNFYYTPHLQLKTFP